MNDGYSAVNALRLRSCSGTCSVFQDVNRTANAGQRVNVGSMVECDGGATCTVVLAVWSGLAESRSISVSIASGRATFLNFSASFSATRSGIRYEVYMTGGNEIRVSDPFLNIGY